MWTKIHPDSVLVGLEQAGSRTISNTVISGNVKLPAMTEEENDLWSEHVGGAGMTEVGGIANFGATTGLITPALQGAIDDWLAAHNIFASRRNPALPLACIGAGFHHDADSYRDEIFCVLWLSDDTPWDVYFPFIGKRIPLTYGTIFVFDSAQPHGVVPHDETVFDEDSFEYLTGVFASQDLVIDRKCRQLMGIEKYSCKGKQGMHTLNQGKFSEDLSRDTGSWYIRYYD